MPNIVRYLVLFSLVFISNQAFCVEEPIKGLPSVALHTFMPSVNKPKDVAVASVISELLLVELSNSNKIDLLDRTLILDAFDEKNLVLGVGAQSASTLSLDKTPAAQYVVTGLFLNAYKNKKLSVRFIKADTGRILGHVILPFEKANLNNAVAKVNQFVHLQINSLKKTSRPKGRSVGIGLFRDVGRSSTSLGLGDDLREKLINQYSKNTDVMARTEMYPLYLESYIEQFQFRSKDHNERPDVPIYIYGDYEVANAKVYLRLHLDLIGQKRLTKTFQASDRIKLHKLVKNYLDKYVLPHNNKASKDDRDKAEKIYQSVLVKNKYKPGLAGRYKNEPWYYVGLVWDDNKAIHANETILSLKEVLKLDPGHDRARLLLAHSLLKRDSSHQKEARKHLKWLYFHSKNAALVKTAESVLHSKISASAFKGIVQDTNKLYTQLIEDKLLTKSGSRGYTYAQALKNKKAVLGDYSKDQVAEILSELQLGYYYIPKKSEEKIKRTYRNLESDLHFYYGQKITGLKIERKNSLVFISEIDVPYSGVRINKELTNAIDELTSAIYLDSEFLIAKLFLAHTLKAFGEHYLPHANLLFQDVLSSTQNDELKFLAADALDRIDETHFTKIFDLDLKNSGYLAKKYEARYKKQSDKPGVLAATVADKLLERVYIKNLKANCDVVLYQSTRKHSVLHWMDFDNECLVLFEKMSQDAIDDEASYTLREKVLKDYKSKHPGLVPHLLMTNNFDNPKFIKQQTEILNEIKQGRVQPLSEIELIYQLKKTMPDWSKNKDDIDLAISYYQVIVSLEKSSHHDKLELAGLYTITGDTRGKNEMLKASAVQAFDISGTPDKLLDGHYQFQKSDNNGNMIYSCKSNPDHFLQYTKSKKKAQSGHWSLGIKNKVSYMTRPARYGPIPNGKGFWHIAGNYKAYQDIRVSVPKMEAIKTGPLLPDTENEKAFINAKKVPIKPFIDQSSSKTYGIKGQGVTVFDNDIIIGTRSLRSSSVSLYDGNGVRTQQASLKNKEGDDYGRKHTWFGASVYLYKDQLIVGAPHEKGAIAINEESFSGSSIAERYSPKKIMSMLFDKDYIDVFGFITPKLTHNSVNIRKDFSQLDNIEASSIWKVLNKNMRVENTGSAHIFRKINGQWQREGLLLASDAHKQNMFGNRVAIYDDTALICARGRNSMLYSKETRLSDVSGAYIFHKLKEGWKQNAKITEGNCIAVALGKNWLFATMKSDAGSGHTIAVFKKVKNKWQKWQDLSVKSLTAKRQDWYHDGVIDVDETTGTLVVGHQWDEVSGNRRAGSAHVFHLKDNKWHKIQKLNLTGPATSFAEFGSAIGVSSDYLAIGARSILEKPGDQGGIGKVYLYKKNNDRWHLKEILSPADGEKDDKFGGAISIDGKNLVIASTRDNGKNKVYLYKIRD